MNIGVAYENGRIAKNLGDCREVLIITTEGREPVGKRIAGIAGTSATDLIKFGRSGADRRAHLRFTRSGNAQRTRDARRAARTRLRRLGGGIRSEIPRR